MLELIERVNLKILARIEQPKITWTVRHEGHDGTSAKAGWKPPKYSAAHASDPGPSTYGQKLWTRRRFSHNAATTAAVISIPSAATESGPEG